jgi:C4-dicarboxylate-specific signal transduction histidine kinase
MLYGLSNILKRETREGRQESKTAALSGGARYNVECRVLRPTGEVRIIDSRGDVKPDTSGRPTLMFGTVQDITDRKRAEHERERLRQLEADLAHVNRVSTLGEMSASLAHEIKQPIAAAITSANRCIEWLAHEPPNLDRARAAAARIDKYGNRAAEIIDRIRLLYKKSPPQRELVDVNGIIYEMLTLLKGEAHRYPIAMRRTDHRPAQNHGRPCAAATSVHEPHAQRHRSHEGLRRRAYGEVGTAGRSTPVLGQ